MLSEFGQHYSQLHTFLGIFYKPPFQLNCPLFSKKGIYISIINQLKGNKCINNETAVHLSYIN